MTDREIIQQALDALLHMYNTTKAQNDYNAKIVDKALVALEAALAQPEQDHGFDRTASHMAGEYVDTVEQKPVEVMQALADNDCAIAYADGWNACVRAHKHTVPPPKRKWVGLTDEEIQLMAHSDDKGDWNDLRFRSCWYNGYVDGVNVANVKLKEKNT